MSATPWRHVDDCPCGQCNSVSHLDRINASREVLVAALNEAHPSPDWAWGILNTWDTMVEVARAAQATVEAHYETAGWATIAERTKLWNALDAQHAALARLEERA